MSKTLKVYKNSQWINNKINYKNRHKMKKRGKITIMTHTMIEI